MQTSGEILVKHGIHLKAIRHGNSKTLCPQCSHTRKNKRDACLSVKIDTEGLAWHCFNCDWHGGEYFDDRKGLREHGGNRFRKAENKSGNRRKICDFYR